MTLHIVFFFSRTPNAAYYFRYSGNKMNGKCVYNNVFYIWMVMRWSLNAMMAMQIITMLCVGWAGCGNMVGYDSFAGWMVDGHLTWILFYVKMNG